MAQDEKGKSTRRFKTGKDIATHLLPTLPNSSYAAVVLYCWLHGYQHGRETTFTESANQIGRACRISPRHVQRILSDLEQSGCIETIRKGFGNVPSTRKILRKRYQPQPSEG